LLRKNIRKKIISENTVFLNSNSSTYTLVEAPLEALKFPVPLFLSPEFIRQKQFNSLCSFQLISTESEVIQSTVSFVIDGNRAMSLPATPFGSFYSDQSLAFEAAHYFVNAVKEQLRLKGIESLVVKHFPACYGKEVHDVFLKAMLAEGFDKEVEEINQYINVSNNSFSSFLHESERRRLKKCHQAGFTVECSTTCDADVWFDRIVRARTLKGHPLTIDLDGLKKLNAVKPECYRFFSIKDQDKIIASAVAIEVLPDVLYYYLPSDEATYQQYSPMVMLIEALYEYAQQKSMRTVDLGISTSGGVLNEGLYHFKSHLGAADEYKYVLGCYL